MVEPAPASDGDPWYQPHVAALDKDTLAWLDGSKFPDPVAALKSGASAAKLARDRNVIPAPDPAKLGEWDGWSKLGWDPDAAKYGNGIEIGKGFEGNAKLHDAFVKAAHELKAPGAIAKGLWDKTMAAIAGEVEAFKAQGAKASADLETALRAKWGADYDTRAELAKRASATLGLKGDALAKLEAAIGGSPELLEAFHGLGVKLGEANLVTGQGGQGGLTPAAAAAERRRLEGDKAWMAVFTDERNPLQADYAAQRMKLIEIEAKGRRAAG